MKVEQLSIFLENKPGMLEQAAKVLAEKEINIRALSLADTSDFGILRIIVNDIDKAEKALHEKGFTVRRTFVVAVAVPDRPGGFHSILAALSEKNISTEYTYAFVERSKEKALIIFRFDRTDEAIDVLQENGFTVIPGSQVYNL